MNRFEKKEVKIFVLKAFVFLLPLGLAALFVEIQLGKIPNSYSKKRQDLTEQASDIEILVAGNSQSMYGINPQYLSAKSYNLANSSQSLYYDKRLILAHLDKMPRLRTVVLPISYFSLYFQLGESKEAWRDFYYDRFWDIAADYLPLFESKRYSYTMLYTPKETVRYIAQGFKVDFTEGFRKDGFFESDSLGNGHLRTEQAGLSRIQEHHALINEKRFAEIQADLEDFVKTLKAKNIAVIFVLMPVWKTYAAHSRLDICQRNEQTLADLSYRYGCQFFNSWADSRFEEQDFRDCDHLNKSGSEKFTKILNDLLLLKK
jgi:hypothetical protein